jgi:hypothetical protein
VGTQGTNPKSKERKKKKEDSFFLLKEGAHLHGETQRAQITCHQRLNTAFAAWGHPYNRCAMPSKERRLAEAAEAAVPQHRLLTPELLLQYLAFSLVS